MPIDGIVLHDALSGQPIPFSSTLFTPSAAGNVLLTAQVVSEPVFVDTPTGAGYSFTLLESFAFSVGRGTFRFQVHFAIIPNTTALQVGFTGSGSAQSWMIAEAQGADGVPQSADGSVVATSLTVNLAAFASALNATLGFFATVGVGDVMTLGSGFTNIGETGGTVNIKGEWKNSVDQSVDMSVAPSAQIGGVALELAAAAGGVPSGLMLLGVGS